MCLHKQERGGVGPHCLTHTAAALAPLSSTPRRRHKRAVHPGGRAVHRPMGPTPAAIAGRRADAAEPGKLREGGRAAWSHTGSACVAAAAAGWKETPPVKRPALPAPPQVATGVVLALSFSEGSTLPKGSAIAALLLIAAFVAGALPCAPALTARGCAPACLQQACRGGCSALRRRRRVSARRLPTSFSSSLPPSSPLSRRLRLVLGPRRVGAWGRNTDARHARERHERRRLLQLPDVLHHRPVLPLHALLHALGGERGVRSACVASAVASAALAALSRLLSAPPLCGFCRRQRRSGRSLTPPLRSSQ